MANEKRRILELFYILAKQADYISSNELAQLVKVTERTVKNDMKELELFIQACGAKLLSKKGKGYLLEILDSESFEFAKQQLSYRLDIPELFSSGEMHKRTNDILRRIIVEENYITIDDIAEELYLTKSSIVEEMKEVNRVLESYNLRIKHKSEKGPYVLGKEFDRRLLMVRIFEVHFHEAITLFKYTDYLRYFECDEEVRLDARQQLLKVLRNTKVRVTDDFTQRMSRYLILLSTRNKEGSYLQFSTEEKTFIEEFKQYEVAKMVLNSLQKYEIFNVGEEESYGIALLLLIWADLDSDSDLEAEYGAMFVEASILAEEMKNQILIDYQIDISEIPRWHNILLTALIPIVIQLRFSCVRNSIQEATIVSEDVLHSPFSIALAKSANAAIMNKYGTNISLLNLLILASRLYFILNYVGYDFKKINAAVVSTNGIEVSKSIRALVEHRVGLYFEKIDVFELYEMRQFNLEEYDWVILSSTHFGYRYDWPYVLVNMIPTQEQMNILYNEIVLGGVQLMPLIENLNIGKIRVFRDQEFENYDSFCKLLSFKIGETSLEITEIEQYLKYYKSTFCYNRVAAIFLPNSLTSKNLIEIYQLKTVGYWSNKPIEIIIVISINFNSNLQLAHFVEQFTNEYVRDPEQLWLLAENPRKEYVIEAIKAKLKTQPISLV